MGELKTIFVATYPQDLMVLRSKLESENIECFVPDELTLQTNPFYSNALGGLKLQIKDVDIEHAHKILIEGGYTVEQGNPLNEKNQKNETPLQGNEIKNNQICPYCGSEEIFKNKISAKTFAISVLLLGFPIPFIGQTYHCFNCSEDFKIKYKKKEREQNIYDP